jgi:hypothetical protein
VTDQFWLYRWLDEHEITSSEQAKSLLRPRSRAVRRLHELAAADPLGQLPPYQGDGAALVAGRGIDLSGDLDCCQDVRQRTQVDVLFGRVLHYFDEIVVAGPPAHRYAKSLETADQGTLDNIAEHVAALLYLREIGAADMLIFVQKPPAREEDYRQHAADAGVLDVIDGASHWIDRLADHGEIKALQAHADHWHYTFIHQDLEHLASGVIASGTGGEAPDLRDVAESVFARYASHLVSDVVTARSMALPLGSSVQLHEEALARTTSSSTVGDVAFDLVLPVLDTLPIRDVIRLRQDEWEYFDRFRSSLTQAIEERLSTGESSAAVAADVARSVIEPAINDIDRRLHVAQRVLDRKLGASAVFGGAVTTIGLLAGAPLIVGAGIAAMGTSLSAAYKYFEDKGSIELNDMYFLWRLQQPAHGI